MRVVALFWMCFVDPRFCFSLWLDMASLLVIVMVRYFSCG
jgi:hypothetical protein